jgi:hypothetical protein
MIKYRIQTNENFSPDNYFGVNPTRGGEYTLSGIDQAKSFKTLRGAYEALLKLHFPANARSLVSLAVFNEDTGRFSYVEDPVSFSKEN